MDVPFDLAVSAKRADQCFAGTGDNLFIDHPLAGRHCLQRRQWDTWQGLVPSRCADFSSPYCRVIPETYSRAPFAAQESVPFPTHAELPRYALPAREERGET